MPTINQEARKRLEATLVGMSNYRSGWYAHWQELANFLLPRRYTWLTQSVSGSTVMAATNGNPPSKNGYILDSTGTLALKILQSGMMNGITSPTRPWLRFKGHGVDEDDQEARIWYDDVAKAILAIMANSNFYQSLATVYGDLGGFGTAAMLIYEDFEQVINCYNSPLGEYFLGQDNKQRVNRFAREFTWTVDQVVAEFGIENCSDSVQKASKAGGAQGLSGVILNHMIEPNEGEPKAPKNFKFREVYWEKSRIGEKGTVLRIRGFNEMPGIFPRWETTGNDVYASNCPGMEALPDIIQLQHETKKKAQALDKMVSPPVLADISLSNRPISMMPNGVTFVAGNAQTNFGVKTAYEVRMPIQELTADIREVQSRIKETFHNDLFQMISQLETVRSATEIDARREEKLILLGPVLNRFDNEALDRAVTRIFQIAYRGRLLPPPPESVKQTGMEIQYIGVLTAAQSAVATAPTERFLAFTGNLAAVFPEVLDIPNTDELVLTYARDLGVPAKGLNSREQIDARRQARQQPQQAEQMLGAVNSAADSAKLLSETPVGAGGDTALSTLIGGGQ